jgi:hypothetical protein
VLAQGVGEELTEMFSLKEFAKEHIQGGEHVAQDNSDQEEGKGEHGHVSRVE